MAKECVTRRVSCCWKFWQVAFYAVAFVGGVIASVTLAIAVRNFDGRCPLYTALNCTLGTSNSTGERVVFDADHVEVWRKNSDCDFTTFAPMSGATVAFILAYFVIMFDTAHKVSQKRSSHNRMIGLFFPLLLTSLVLSILMLASSVRTLQGTEVFCTSIFNSLSVSCQEAQFFEWQGFPLVNKFYDFLLSSVITTWIATAAYILSIMLLFIRCCCKVDDATITSKDLSPPNVKVTEPQKPPFHKGHHRQDSTQPLLESMSASDSPSTSALKDEPEPGTSAFVPELVVHPPSPPSPLTVAT